MGNGLARDKAAAIECITRMLTSFDEAYLLALAERLRLRLVHRRQPPPLRRPAGADPPRPQHPPT